MKNDGPMTDDVAKPINANSRFKSMRTRTGPGMSFRTPDATAESSTAARCRAIGTSDERGRRAIPAPTTHLDALSRYGPPISDCLTQSAR